MIRLTQMATQMTSAQDQWKKVAAEAAAKLVEDGMVVGLGSGTTTALFVAALARRIADERLRIVGVPTSLQTEQQARSLNIPITTLAEQASIDLTIDGADEVVPGSLFLIKGHGGALLREKIVASCSKRMAVVADETKIVKRLGSLVSVPVEIVPFGWEATQRKLEGIGAKPCLRTNADGKPYVTDGGHYIMNCAFGPIDNPKEVADRLDHIVGVVEHGLFLHFATEALIAGRSGLKILKRESGVAAPRARRGRARLGQKRARKRHSK
ncbi:MAG: ribose-5-phosphate isomerase RpiA [Candidatus Acidiferrales bacterium]